MVDIIKYPYEMPHFGNQNILNPNNFIEFEDYGHTFLHEGKIIVLNSCLPKAHTIWSKDFYSNSYFSNLNTRAQRVRQISVFARRVNLKVSLADSSMYVFYHKTSLGKYKKDGKKSIKEATFYEAIVKLKFINKKSFLDECEKAFGFPLSFIGYLTILVGSDTPNYHFPVGNSFFKRKINDNLTFYPMKDYLFKLNINK